MVKQNSLFANQIVKVNLLWWTRGNCQQGRRTDLPWQLHVGRCLILAGLEAPTAELQLMETLMGVLKPSQKAK